MKHDALSFLAQDPVNVVRDFDPGRLIDADVQGARYRVTAVACRSDAWVDTGAVFILRDTRHLDH